MVSQISTKIKRKIEYLEMFPLEHSEINLIFGIVDSSQRIQIEIKARLKENKDVDILKSALNTEYKKLKKIKLILENKYLSKMNVFEYTDKKQKFKKLPIIEKEGFFLEPSDKTELTSNMTLKDLSTNLLRLSISSQETLITDFLEPIIGKHFNNDKLESLLKGIRQKYKLVPYHNYSHGISVMQNFNMMIEKIGIKKLNFTEEYVGIILIACLGHDLGHPGTNNLFHENTNSKYASYSNYNHILESFHSSNLLKLISKMECNIFDNLSIDKQTSIKKSIAEAIFSTDMSMHKNILQTFLELDFDHLKENNPNVISMLVHSSDLSNVLLPFEYYLHWTYLLSQEFNNQTLIEKQHNVKVTDMFVFKGYSQFVRGQNFFMS